VPHNDDVVADHPLSLPIGTAPDLASMMTEAVADRWQAILTTSTPSRRLAS
jgi:hypothetical protein